IKAIRLIVDQPNEFFKALAHGAEYAAKIYGGIDFALTFGGNEMPGYHTGPSAYVGYLTGSRHSHLDSAGYSLDEKAASAGKRLTPMEVAEALFEEEYWRQVLSSLVVCFFGRGVYTPDVVVKAFQVYRLEFDVERLKSIGIEILRAKYSFKVREGFNLEKLRIPKRIFETPTPHGIISEEFLRSAIKIFKEKIEA
ncbi:MAG: aldehyde:ferredoxin oxidoreductase, partial [Candidatus Bathyarchaeota archaeon]|nr:aldehyde:ferredoxin oxidoreductase [Candidatus Bathyarchaeota archaeon]